MRGNGKSISLCARLEFCYERSMDSIFIRLAVVCLLAFLGFEAFKELKKPDKEAYIELHRTENEAYKIEHDGAEMEVPGSKIKNPVKLL